MSDKNKNNLNRGLQPRLRCSHAFIKGHIEFEILPILEFKDAQVQVTSFSNDSRESDTYFVSNSNLWSLQEPADLGLAACDAWHFLMDVLWFVIPHLFI